MFKTNKTMIDVCMALGHRDIESFDVGLIKSELRREIEFAIDMGCERFICGMAQGSDLIFAEIVAEIKQSRAVQLEAVLPYASYLASDDPQFQQIIIECDTIHFAAEYYSSGCFAKRNRFMVDNSGLIIAVYDGRLSGGTYSTLVYASEKCRRVVIINPRAG